MTQTHRDAQKHSETLNDAKRRKETHTDTARTCLCLIIELDSRVVRPRGIRCGRVVAFHSNVQIEVRGDGQSVVAVVDVRAPVVVPVER